MVLVTLNTAADLYTLMLAPAVGPSGTYSLTDDYELGSNIDMSAYTAESIGYTDTTNGFRGNFDGKNYTITIPNISATYGGFILLSTGGKTIKDINVVYNNPSGGTFISSIGNTGGFISGSESDVTNCNITFGNNYTIGDNGVSTGGFIGASLSYSVSNCTLTAGDNFKIQGNPNPGGEFSGFFIGTVFASSISSCTILVGNNSNIIGYSGAGGIIGLIGLGSLSSSKLTIGNNCTITVTSKESKPTPFGGLVGQLTGSSPAFPASISNCWALYGENVLVSSAQVIGGALGFTDGLVNSSNCLVMYGENAQCNGSNFGGAIGSNNYNTASNIFVLYKSYYVKGSNPGPIYSINTSGPGTDIYTYSCIGALPGSDLTTISTLYSTLVTISTLLSSILFLSEFSQYILDNYNYCPPPPIPPYVPPCAEINKCRFCYSYKPSGIINNCCPPPICATNEYLSSISSCTPVIYNSSRTSEKSLLLYGQQQYLQEINASVTNQIVQSTIASASSVNDLVYGQLLQVKQNRYLPYRPYIPEVVPQSVIDLQMATVNVGVPQSFFTYMDCKGNQTVTRIE
jgi:hypothetical protein